MKHTPFLDESTDTCPLLRSNHVEFDFEFPTAISSSSTKASVQNDIVFCGKIIGQKANPNSSETVRNNNPFLARTESVGKISSGRHSGSISYLKSSSDGDNRRRSSGSWKHYNGLFGVLKYPMQMELSDIKMRQERMEPVSLPRFPAVDGGEVVVGGGRKSKWALVRRLSLKRRERRSLPISTVAKGSFGCLPIPLA